MNKTIFLSLLLVSVFFSCSAQKTQERSISAFNKIKISGAVNVIYTNSDSLNLVVKAKENELENVETRVENSVLFITSKGRSHSELYVYVKGNQLQSIVSSGAGTFKTTNVLRTDSLNFNVSGAAEVQARVETHKIRCTEDGAGMLQLEGLTDLFTGDISGAASLKSYKLISKEAVLTTSGAANAKIHVTDKLKATATSASEIKVMGDPKDVVTETTTAANITRIKDSSVNVKTDSDTTTFNWKKKKILIIGGNDDSEEKSKEDREEGFKHWRGFSMGVNGFMNPGGGIVLNRKYNYMDLDYRRSLNFQFNIVERQFNIIDNRFKLVTGLGFDYHLFELANRTILNADSSFTAGRIDTSNFRDYKRNKLRCTYLQVPLLLEFNTSNDSQKAFHIAFGVIGEFLISSRTKQVLMEGKNKTVNVRKDSYNMSPFAAKAHVNLGYRNWTFFGEYNLTPLFQSGKGPELYTFTAGIRLVPLG